MESALTGLICAERLVQCRVRDEDRYARNGAKVSLHQLQRAVGDVLPLLNGPQRTATQRRLQQSTDSAQQDTQQ
jgi:hypothetical protein